MRGKKRKKDTSNEEEDYEQQPRSFASENKNENMRMLLPIIDKGRVIKQMAERDEHLENKGGFFFYPTYPLFKFKEIKFLNVKIYFV